MSVRFVLALLVALAALGCASSHCGPAPEPIDAAEVVDAGIDAACSGGSTIYLVATPRTADALGTGHCVPGSRGIDARLLDANGHGTGDVIVECVSGFVYRVATRPPGHYLLTLRYGTQTIAGGTLLGDTACPNPSFAPCDPIDVVVTDCAPTVIPYTLPCPAGTTDCGGGA